VTLGQSEFRPTTALTGRRGPELDDPLFVFSPELYAEVFEIRFAAPANAKHTDHDLNGQAVALIESLIARVTLFAIVSLDHDMPDGTITDYPLQLE
jgi:hypothetical protein